MRYNQSMAQILSEMQAQEGRMKDLSMKVNKVIAKMKKDRQMKGFADKFKRDVMRSMDIEKSLEKVLPDYIAGKEIQKLVKEQEGEQEDPIDQAKKKIDKIKKLAVLKKQMQDIQKSDEDTDLEEKVEYIEYKFRNSKQAVDAVRFVQAMNTGVPRNLDINSDQENKGIIVFDAGKDDFTKVHKMIVKKFRPQILAVERVEEETDLEEFTDKQIERLRKEYESLRGKETGINPDKFKKLRGMMKRFPKANLLKLVKADIPVLTTGAKAALVMYHGMKWKQLPEDFLPYVELFAEEVDEQKGKFKSIDPKVLARISNMMRGSKEEKQSLANMLNYFMPPEVVDMVRDKFGIKMPRGKIKFTDL